MAILCRKASHRLAVALTAAIVSLHAQESASRSKYTYEVASIHRAAPEEINSGFNSGPQSGMICRNVTALMALSFAYDARDYQFFDVPGWARSERYYITFTPGQSEIVLDENSPRASVDGWLTRQRQRLQAVLRDRFSLTLRQETRQLPVYNLTVAKNGHKLSAPAHPERGQSTNFNGGRQIVGANATMNALAGMLSSFLGHPVRDETGLDGAYDFKVDWAPDPTMTPSRPTAGSDASPSAVDPGRASLFTALTEQLGLRLESRTGPVPVFVIEKIERPSEN